MISSSCRGAPAAGCRWAAPTSGGISSTASSSAGGSTGPSSIGVTTPLITTADGAKMGKTAQGAVWLNAELLSPYDYWQFWRNTADADVGRFLQAVHRPAAGGDRAGSRACRARRSTRPRSCSRPKRRRCSTAARRRRPRRRPRADNLRGGRRRRRSADAQHSATASPSLAALTGLGFCASNGEAKRKIAEGAVRLDDETVSDPALMHRGRRRAGASSASARRRHGLLGPLTAA